LTCACILSLARNVPQAAASMKAGKWARKEYMGEEVYGKTLAIIGLGRIGSEVASRMQSFGMTTIGYDPIVSAEEPPSFGALIEHPKIICTPHLGASTIEAQERVASEIAENIIALNNGSGLYGALNAAALNAVLDEAKAQWVRAANALAHILSVIADSPKSITLRYPKAASGLNKGLMAGAIVGLLQGCGNAGMNLINAEMNAKKEGIQVNVEPSTENELVVCAGATSVSGYPSPAGTIVSAFNASRMPVPLIAVGTLAINLKETRVVRELPDSLKAKLSVDYGLVGGGCVALFGSLSADEVEQLSVLFDVVQF
uniref:2-Hacid_dh_C domain-containing protein n=1 Tax=Anisakis simplex TaxID=6269 RepID=A0A0M3K6K6_ANISI